VRLMIHLPPGTPLLNSNDRRGKYAHAKLVKDIKTLAGELVKDAEPFPSPGKVKITATFYPGTRHRHDPGNMYPTVKAMIDALVPSVLPDDSSKYVSSLTMIVSDEIIKGGQMSIEVSDE
jgi:hypothetical protein